MSREELRAGRRAFGRQWWPRIARYARPHGARLALVLLLTLLGVGVAALHPWPMKLIVDHVLHGQPLPAAASWFAGLPGAGSEVPLLAWLVVATVLLFLAQRALAITQEYVQTGIGNRLVFALGAELFDHLQRLSLTFHAHHAAGDLVRRITSDTRCARQLVLSVILPVVTSIASLIVMFSIMWRLDPSLSLLTLLAALPLGLLIRMFARPMTRRSYEQMQAEGAKMAQLEQTLSALPIVQAFGREPYEDGRFRALADRTVRAHLRATLAQLQFKAGTKATTALGVAAIMALGGKHVLDGTLTIGSLLVFLSYLYALYAPLETLAYLSSGFASAAAGARRVLEVLDVPAEVMEAPAARSLPGMRAKGHVVLEAVTFGYEAARPVLRGASVEGRPGETVALVGRTGAGKSTLVSLIPRFFDPWQGRVLLDGEDVRELALEEVREQVALVLQDAYVLPLTIAENIAYGRPRADRAAIERVARAANVDEFALRLPLGYATVVGERGTTLSGGERQRLAIARALLKDAPVLILDEPTASLDAETEEQVLEALERLMAGRTTFLIAHRLSTVQRADRIVVLEEGEVVEEGTHAELVRVDGPYARFHAAERRTFRRRKKAATPATAATAANPAKVVR